MDKNDWENDDEDPIAAYLESVDHPDRSTIDKPTIDLTGLDFTFENIEESDLLSIDSDLAMKRTVTEEHIMDLLESIDNVDHEFGHD